jgi:hypothetical protein
VDLILPAIERTGVRIAREVSLARFSSLLGEQGVDVVILFSHWHRSAVEFADGLKTVSEIIDAIPTTFCGILDLSICHPLELVKRLKAERPNIAMIRFATVLTTPRLWLFFYLALFKTLSAKDIAYLIALDSIFEEFSTQLSEFRGVKFR